MGAFSQVSRYRIFYDKPTAAIIEDMANYDLVIIEPVLYSVSEIAYIRSRGTTVLGYLSVMQASAWDQSFYKRLSRKDFYRRNGQKVYFPIWRSCLMDLTSANYRRLLKEKIQEHFLDKSVDGLFLDTVGDLDDQFAGDPAGQIEQRKAFQTFLEEMKQQAGNMPIIQNWGFETLRLVSAPFVDGIMWESFHADVVKGQSWSKTIIEKLDAIQQEYPLDVFTVSFKKHRESSRLAAEHKYIHYPCTATFNVWHVPLINQAN